MSLFWKTKKIHQIFGVSQALARTRAVCKLNIFLALTISPHTLAVLVLRQMGRQQCDQIGQFIGFWATFQSLWQQLICPNLPHFQAIFKLAKPGLFCLF